jgi:hypothetical protein
MQVPLSSSIRSITSGSPSSARDPRCNQKPFDKNGSLGYTYAMKRIFVSCVIVCIFSLLYASDSSVGKEAVLSLPLERKLPVHATLGLLSDPSTDASGAAGMLSTALQSPYGFDWYEAYVHPSVKIVVNSMYDGYFSDILPADRLVLSQPDASGDLCSMATLFIGSDKNHWQVVFSLTRDSSAEYGWLILGLGAVRKAAETAW